MEYPNNIYPAGFIGPLPPGATRATATSPDLLKGSTAKTTGSKGSTGVKTDQPLPIAPQVQQQSNPMALFMAMNAMQSQFRSNNAMMQQRNLLLKHLYDTPLTAEEINQLDPTMKNAVLNNDRDQIDMSLRLISDEVQGRNQAIDSSFQFLTKTYMDTIEKAEQQRQQSQEAVLNYTYKLSEASGKKVLPSEVAKALGYQGDFTALDTLAAPGVEQKIKTDESVYKFTQNQLQTGAARAGVLLNDFNKFSDESKNKFVNDYSQITKFKKTIDDAFKNGENPAELEAEISEELKDYPEIADYLIKYLWSVFPRPTNTNSGTGKPWYQFWK